MIHKLFPNNSLTDVAEIRPQLSHNNVLGKRLLLMFFYSVLVVFGILVV